MTALWIIAIILLSLFHSYHIGQLRSKINKQQEQMSQDYEHLNQRLNKHLEMFDDITEVCQKIATKVVSIEKQVDKLN